MSSHSFLFSPPVIFWTFPLSLQHTEWKRTFHFWPCPQHQHLTISSWPAALAETMMVQHRLFSTCHVKQSCTNKTRCPRKSSEISQMSSATPGWGERYQHPFVTSQRGEYVHSETLSAKQIWQEGKRWTFGLNTGWCPNAVWMNQPPSSQSSWYLDVCDLNTISKHQPNHFAILPRQMPIRSRRWSTRGRRKPPSRWWWRRRAPASTSTTWLVRRRERRTSTPAEVAMRDQAWD